MPRLTNSTTGIVVNVSDEHAARLTSNGWAAQGSSDTATDKTEAKQAPAKKTASKEKTDG